MPPSTQGQWQGAMQTPGDSDAVGDGHGVFVIHATLLRNGKVLWFSGHAESIHYLGESWIWDPTQPPNTAVRQGFPSSSEDLFCGHHAVLDDGRVIVVGGATSAHGDGIDGTGVKAICVLDPMAATPSWSRIGEMAHGRWYPTLVTLPDGRLVAFSGHRELGVGGISPTVELFSPPFTGPGYTTVTLAGGDKIFPTYPGLHLVRGGRIFHAGPTWRYETPVTDPIGTWSFRLLSATTAAWTDHSVSPHVDLREEGTSVLLPPAQDGKILVVGGAKATDYSGTSGIVAGSEPRAAEILDTTSSPPTWTRIADMAHPRINVSAVLLPDGKVLVLGGHDRFKWNPASVNANEAELYDPILNTWTVAAAMSESRTYHSAALLLPNGSVIVAGGVDPNQAEPGHTSPLNRKTFEIYQPPYFFNGTRPNLTNATGVDVPTDQIAYGGFLDVDVDIPAADIRKVVLMRPGSMTHHTDTEQRYVPLPFVVTGTNRVRAVVVNDASVAPPGYYMLWVVDAMNRPCQQARFVRLMRQQCSVLIDKSHYSADEVGAPGANFEESFYVVMDGFTPGELGLPTGAIPTLADIQAAAPSVTFHRADGSTITTMSSSATNLIIEETPPPAGLRQRFAFKFTLTFANRSIFYEADGTTEIESQNVTIRATKSGFTCRGGVTLNHQQNPFMIDGATPWLSVDLRVFKMTENETLFARNVGTTPATALTFIQTVLNDFNASPAAARTSFETTISPEQDTPLTKLDILESRGGKRIFNFAIAQVRYRGQALLAQNVRVFFRAFTTAATGMDFRPETYPTLPHTVSGDPIPVLGLQGGAVATIPFFATERVNSSFQRLDEQSDPSNIRSIGTTSTETTAYFGCWLDFNQTALRYPLYPGSSIGPWSSGLQSLQQHVRGKHQCLVAEVHFPSGDAIPPGATPGGHDNLSQRNLAIDESDNPGGPASHRVQHTFEVRPSATHTPPSAAYPPFHDSAAPQAFMAVAPQTLLAGDGCDELMFLWGNLPRESRVTLYLPDCNIDEILEIAARRAGPQRLEKAGDDTILCQLGDVTYVPLPSGRATNIPGLLTIDLPAGVRKKQEFRVVVRQFDGVRREIIGTFEFRIPVRTAPEILLEQQETLAVMKHIALSIPPADRWYLIFNRYLLQLGEKVRALGGDPDAVQPSPDDSGVPGAGDRERPDNERLCCTMFWTNAVLLAFAVALLAWSHAAAGRTSFTFFALLFVVFLVVWTQRCRPSLCRILTMLLIGGVLGMGLLALFVFAGLAPPVPFGIVGVLLVLLAVIAVAKVARRCVEC